LFPTGDIARLLKILEITMLIHHGMNRVDLDRLFRSLGGQIVPVPGTGDIRYSHPAMPQRPRANARRKDAPRSLTAFVLKVASARKSEVSRG
jgi:hypothetical protein